MSPLWGSRQLSLMVPTSNSVNLTFRHGPSKTCEYRENDFVVSGRSIECEFQEVKGEEKTNLDLFIAQYNDLLKLNEKNNNMKCSECKKNINSFFAICDDCYKEEMEMRRNPKPQEAPMAIRACGICREGIGKKDYSIVHSDCLDNFDLDCPMFRMASFSEVVKNQRKQIQSLIEKYNSYRKYSSGKTEDLLEEIDYDITSISHFFDSILNYRE